MVLKTSNVDINLLIERRNVGLPLIEIYYALGLVVKNVIVGLAKAFYSPCVGVVPG